MVNEKTMSRICKNCKEKLIKADPLIIKDTLFMFFRDGLQDGQNIG